MLVSFLAVPFTGDASRKRVVAGLVASALAGFVLFSAAFKLQPSMRFHFSLFALMAPVVGHVGAQIPVRRWSPWIALGLYLAAVPVVVADRWRPLVRIRPLVYHESVFTAPRSEMSLRILEAEADSWVRAAQTVLESGCKDVGLRIDSSDLECPWWVLLDPVRNGIRMEHVFAFPTLERFADPGFKPCAIICTICGEDWQPVPAMRMEDMGAGIRLYLR